METLQTCILLFAVLAMTGTRASGSEMMLVTAGGDHLAGEWQDAADSTVVTWQAEEFVGPFEFLPDAITAVYGSPAAKDDGENDDSRACICELVTGDILFGMPVSLDSETLEFQLNVAMESKIDSKADSTTDSEVVSIPRKMIRRLTGPTNPDELIVDFPGVGNALLVNESREWKITGGKLVAGADNVTCFLKLPELPTRVLMNVDLSWEANTDFAVSLMPKKLIDKNSKVRGMNLPVGFGLPPEKKDAMLDNRGLRLESWGNRIVLTSQAGDECDLLLVADNLGGHTAGSLRLQIYLDAEQKTASVYRDGQLVGELSLLFSASKEYGWRQATEAMRFESYEGRLAVERLRISTWNGRGPYAPAENEASVVRMTNGENVSRIVVAWDAKTKAFTLEELPKPGKETRQAEDAKRAADKDEKEDSERDKEEEREEEEATGESEVEQIALADLVEIIFNNPSPAERKLVDETTVLTKAGSQVTGFYSGIRDGRLYLECSKWKQLMSFPTDSIVSAIFRGRMAKAEEQPPGVKGTMRLANSEIKGRLVAAKTGDGTTCLAWHPALARNAQSLVPESNGTITYRPKKSTVAKKNKSQSPPKRGAVAGFLNRLAKHAGAPAIGKDSKVHSAGQLSAGGLMTLELRSGDSIPFRPKRIDEEGVTFESPLSDVTFVSHAQVKAITLRSKLSPAELTDVKRERLLTVPRRFKDRPPTHLLLSVNQDVLRGRLISMDEEFVTIEMRLTPRRIPRERVAAIVWLDEVVPADEETDAEAAEDVDGIATAPSPEESEPVVVARDGFHVLATKRGGQRITIIPEYCEASVLYGTNPVVEECKLDLAEVNELAFGSDIEKVIETLETNRIVLTSAAQPRFMSADEAGGAGASGAGQDSALVGEPAPPIELKRLNGKRYDLKKEKGKIIVLDFWATWCGPCIQWMPRAEAIVDEFAGEEVELVAVNLSETKDVITPVLKRLELDPIVLLDIDGVVADSYKASAIPQTVVIDRSGNVDRVLVGGGKQNETLLRESLKTLTEAE